VTNRQRIKYWKRILWHLNQAQDIFEKAQLEASDKGAEEFTDFDFLGTTLGCAQDDAVTTLTQLEREVEDETNRANHRPTI